MYLLVPTLETSFWRNTSRMAWLSEQDEIEGFVWTIKKGLSNYLEVHAPIIAYAPVSAYFKEELGLPKKKSFTWKSFTIHVIFHG